MVVQKLDYLHQLQVQQHALFQPMNMNVGLLDIILIQQLHQNHVKRLLNLEVQEQHLMDAQLIVLHFLILMKQLKLLLFVNQ